MFSFRSDRVPKSLLTAYLDDALDQAACPICHLGDGTERRYLVGFLREKVTSTAARTELLRSRGFCRQHTYRLLEIGGYGCHAQIVIVYENLVRAMADEVRALDEGRPSGLDMEGECLVCRRIAEREAMYLDLLARRLRKEAFRDQYGRSSGLCMRHFGRVYDLAKPPVRRYLRDDQAARLTVLADDLALFVHKSVVKNEPWGPERDAWIRALRMYAGAEPVKVEQSAMRSVDTETGGVHCEPSRG